MVPQWVLSGPQTKADSTGWVKETIVMKMNTDTVLSVSSQALTAHMKVLVSIFSAVSISNVCENQV